MSAQWSEGLIGVSETNSRSAKKDASANTISSATGPSVKAIANTATSDHEPRMREFSMPRRDRRVESSVRCAAHCPTPVATAERIASEQNTARKVSFKFRFIALEPLARKPDDGRTGAF